jgi:hypothetical protein
MPSLRVVDASSSSLDGSWACLCVYVCAAEVFDSKEPRRARANLAEARLSQHSELADKVIAYRESMRPKIDEKEQ